MTKVKHHHLDPRAIKQIETRVAAKIKHEQEAVFNRFPLLFTMLGTFGVVATFYGFEGLIDRFDVLANNPYILLGVGLAILIITGSLYKKLG